MKPKQMMLFAVAVGCGLVAMICAQQVLSGNKPPVQELVKILVARGDIELGVPLDDTNVYFKDWPKDNVLEGSITSKAEFAECASKVRVSANMPILKSYLGAKGQVGVSSLIPKGMSMVTVQVDITQLHGGLLRPNSYVNISAAITRPAVNGRPEVSQVKTVLKRVKVLAVGDKIAGSEQALKDTSSGAKVETVSFVTYPQKAKLLNLAKVISQNRIFFELLGEEDKSEEETRDLDETAFAQRLDELYGNTKSMEPISATKQIANDKPTGSSFSEYLKNQPVAPEVVELGKKPLKPTWRIEIYNGNNKTVQEHELTDEELPNDSTAESASGGGQWTSPFMKFFSRKRTSKPIVQDTQSDSTDEDAPELPSEKSASTNVDTMRK